MMLKRDSTKGLDTNGKVIRVKKCQKCNKECLKGHQFKSFKGTYICEECHETVSKVLETGLQTCSKCKKEKTLKEYQKRKNSRYTGYHTICKECLSNYECFDNRYRDRKFKKEITEQLKKGKESLGVCKYENLKCHSCKYSQLSKFEFSDGSKSLVCLNNYVFLCFDNEDEIKVKSTCMIK